MEPVVNWIWQGVALTTVTTLVVRRATHLSATTRYLVWWLTMVLVLLLPLVPRFATWLEPAVTPGVGPSLTPLPLPELPAWPLTAAVVGWLAWVGLSLTRVMTSVIALLLARRRVTPFPASREAALSHWAAVRGQGRPARLALCDRIPAAAVFGLGPAIIAVSPSACARLTDEELDQVILHEWAHVQRRDDFSRLAHIVVRVVAGLHPAVWWIGRRLEIERETACDDFAVNVTGAARSLARCLTKLAEVQPRRLPAVLAPGVLASSQLATRVQRLLDPSRNTSTVRARGVLGAIATALVVLAAGLSQVELVAATSALPAALPAHEHPGGPAQVVDPALPGVEIETAAPAAAPAPVGVPGSSSRRPPAPRQVVTTTTTPAAAGSLHDPIAPVAIPSGEHTAWAVATLPAITWSAERGAVPAATGELAAGEVETPWGAAADAGIAIGRGSQKAGTATADAGVSVAHASTKAAVATAGFFSRFGRKLGGSF